MSYDIIYNRQFIKVDENRVIPFLEMGSSNCYEASGRNAKRARSWGNSYAFTDNNDIIVENTKLLANIDAFELSTKERCESYVKEYDDTWAYDPKKFGYHVGIAFYGKHTTGTSFNAFRSYYANGIKEAKTIEELLDFGITFSIHPYYFSEKDITSKGLDIKPRVTFTSTEQMLSVIEEYTNYYNGSGITLYIDTNSGWSIENMKKTLNRQKRKVIKTPVLVDKYYVLETKQGGYFVKKTKYGYKYSYYRNASSTKAFKTEKEANKYNEKHGFGFKVIEVNQSTFLK